MQATQSPTDYKQLLSRLCHLVALSETKKIEGVVDSLVIGVVEVDSNHPANNQAKVDEALRAYFGVQLDPKDLSAAIARLLGTGALIGQPAANTFALSPASRAAQMQRVSDASKLEDIVKQQWIESVRSDFPAWNESVEAELWGCLKSYLTRLFRRHGAQTALIVSGQRFSDAELDKSIGELMTSSIAEECKVVDQNLASNALKKFLREQTPERARYVAQLLDGTFSFYSLFTDDATQSYLKKAIPQIRVFLDTNFLFGVLHLHDNPQNEVSAELVSLVRDQKFPFELQYHEESLKEMQETIRKTEERLVRHNWSSSLSRAAIETREFELSGLDLKFHRANAEHQIGPSAFFMKFHHLEKLLNASGFKIYRRPDKQDADDMPDEKTLDLISRYNKFQAHLPLNRQKGFNSVKHDIIVWQATKALRKPSAAGLDVGALMLSADQRFFAFDWEVLSDGHGLGVVVLPSQLLQLLRPFVPRTPDFDKRFAEVFSLPEFRSGSSDFSQVIRQVLGFLATVKDLTEETAAAILADELLLRRLKNVETEEGVKEAIESEVLKKNAQLAAEHKEAMTKLEAARSELTAQQSLVEAAQRGVANQEQIALARATELEQERREKEKSAAAAAAAEEVARRTKAELTTANEAKSQLTGTLQQTNATVSELQTQLAEIAEAKERTKKILRVIGGIVFTLIGWGVILLLPAIRDWQWLQSHPHKLSFYLAALVLIPGLAWGVFAWKGRAWAFASIVVAVIIRLIGVL